MAASFGRCRVKLRERKRGEKKTKLKAYLLRIVGPLTHMRIVRQIKDFIAGFNETATADRETPIPSPFQRALVIIVVVVLSALVYFLVAKFR